MTRDAFKTLTGLALERLASTAEVRTGRILPRRFCFNWLGKKEPEVHTDVIEFLTDKVYVDEFKIWPCFDLFLERLLPHGRLFLLGYRAGFLPCPYGEHASYQSLGHDAGRVGPFKLGCSHIVEQLLNERVEA